MADHAEIKEALSAYDGLSRDQQVELNAHLVTCVECAQELAAYRRLDRALRSMPAPRPSGRLQAMIRNESAQTQTPARPRAQLTSPKMTQPPALDPEIAEDAEEQDASPKWRRLLLPLAMALLFLASLWAGMRGQEAPGRNRVDVDGVPALAVTTPEDSAVPPASTETPLTIDAAGHVTITFACDGPDELLADYRALVQGFQAQNPDITVQLSTAARLPGDVQAGTEAGNGRASAERAFAADSDVFCAASSRVLGEDGLARDVAPLATRDREFAVDEFYPAVLEQVMQDGALYLVPARFHIALIYYDPAAFALAGLRAPRPGWSWDDLLSTATALTLRDGNNTRRWGFGEADDTFVLARFLSAASSWEDALDPAEGDPFEDERVLDLFRWYQEFYVQRRAAPIPRELDAPESATGAFTPREAEVTRGRFAMWTGVLSGSAPASFRIAPFPVSRAFDKTTPILSVDGWAISPEAQHLDAAWRWVAFLSQNLPADPQGLSVPARRSVPQMRAFWTTIPREDREAYQYALEHLGVWAEVMERPGTLQLYAQLVSMLQGETTLAELTMREPRPAENPHEAPDVITLTFAAPRDQRQDYEAAAAAFSEANGGIHIRIVPSEDLLPSRTGTEILWNQMRVLSGRVDALVNAQVPALVRSGRAQGILLDLTELISGSLRSADYYPNSLEGLQWRGRGWAVPGRLAPRLIHYNTSIFDQMEVSHPQPDWTWADFDRTVRALTPEGDGASSWWGWSEGMTNELQLLKSRTGPLVDYSTSPPTPMLDGPAAVEAAAWYGALLREGTVAPAGQSNKESAMWVATPELERLDDLVKGGVGVAPFPAGPDTSETAPLEIFDAFAISASTPYPEEAWQWLLFLQMHPPVTERYYPGMPARRASGDGMHKPVDPELRAIVEYALEHAHQPAPLRPEEYLVTQQLAAALDRIVQAGQEATAAMEEAQQAAQADLGRRLVR